MVQNICPIFSRIPGDLTGGIDLNGHDLADLATLYDDDSRPDASTLAAALFAAADVLANERVVIRHICPRDNMCRLDRESVVNSQHCDLRIEFNVR